MWNWWRWKKTSIRMGFTWNWFLGFAELECGAVDAVATSGAVPGHSSMGLSLSVPRSPQGKMKLLGALLVAATLLGTSARREQQPWPDEPSQTCSFQALSSVDSEFCR